VIGRARERLGGHGTRTVLFIDEIHRFNKAQQDALLPVVESGLVTLIGATTENPFHSIIGALVSRCRLYEFEGHSQDDLREVLERGATALGPPHAGPDVLAAIAATAAGDARHALSTLELAHEHASSRNEPEVTEHDVAQAVRRRPVRYDRDGDRHYDTISAFIKSVRASDPDAALYYLAVMLEGGEDARFIARRIAILASEDIGNADPRALELAVACARRGAGRPAGVPVRARPGDCLPGAGAQIEHGGDVARRSAGGRSRPCHGATSRGVARRELPGCSRARQRRGLRLSARRARGVRGRRPPATGARRLALLRARGARPRGQAGRARARAPAPARRRRRRRRRGDG
jgi:hypothetical protein